jgi:hypothetical protein
MSFEKLLARSYAPLNFITIHGYPNLLPATSKWLDFLPRLDGNVLDHVVIDANGLSLMPMV